METTTFTKRQILCIKDGEISYTPPSPLREFVPGQDDDLLKEIGNFILSSDDFRGVTGNKYEVHTVVLPSWMTVSEWTTHLVSWKYLWACGADPTWSREVLYSLMPMSTAEKVACIKLLKTKTFRSSFRAGMAEQLKTWINTPAEERKYRSPFSGRQWDSIVDVYVSREARGIDNGAYRSREPQSYGCPLPKGVECV